MIPRLLQLLVWMSVLWLGEWSDSAEPIRVGVFDVDASPPVGTPLAYDPTAAVETPLHSRGVVLLGGDKPIVVCAVDWLGIANESNLQFREAIAKAVGTDRRFVVVHTLHQHDAPRSDLSAERLLIQAGVAQPPYDAALTRRVAEATAQAAARASATAVSITHVGLGQGRVEKVASNRRILGPDGKVKYTRWTACKDPLIRAQPVGTIDPMLKMISFWDGSKCVAAMTFYATHPQSYYRTGKANVDFPGLARAMREAATGVTHIHLNGAGGNIGAGKWNDGSPANRQVLARRVAAGMERAWESTEKFPITTADLSWRVESVKLPPATHLDESSLQSILQDPQQPLTNKVTAAKHLVWLRRCTSGDAIDLACLGLGRARVLFMPGELFVEYQLAAQAMRPDLFVAMAAYGEYGPGYIGTEVAYSQGGYETSQRASRVAPSVEAVLMGGMRRLLEANPQ